MSGAKPAWSRKVYRDGLSKARRSVSENTQMGICSVIHIQRSVMRVFEDGSLSHQTACRASRN